jgi:ArsR family transcriptional regulator, arsenate/arsenite/antimonite-responsive transcriptional repressor
MKGAKVKRSLPQLERSTPALCCAPLAGNDLSEGEARATSDVFKALADPTRIRIVNLLSNSTEPVCVCDINAHFDLSQPTISHHLKKLTSAGVLQREQRGTWAYFSLDDEVLAGLADVFRPKEEVKA